MTGNDKTATPTDLRDNAVEQITSNLRRLLADVFARAVHEICDRHSDVATASLIEVWIDESERRTWFLAEIAQAS
jgi:starvation-inducible DNA-binding protein